MAREGILIGVSHDSWDPQAEIAEDNRQIRQIIERRTRSLAPILANFVRSFAPRDTGRLARSVEPVKLSRRRLGKAYVTGFKIVAGAQRDGYRYLDVTRFGHAKAFIRPKRARFLKVHLEGRANPPVSLRVVRGADPAYDWVERALDGAEPLIANHSAQTEREVDAVLAE